MTKFIQKKFIREYADIISPFSNQLASLYAEMDEKYHEAAAYYDFHCRGCKDNCCLTRFYHHTFLEYFYIIQGYQTLDIERQADIRKKADQVCHKAAELEKAGSTVRIMCPLNAEGLCLLYEYRPMICRLHGIPHELRRPDGKIIYGPGCEAFTNQAGDRNYFRFDRTPFYVKMAEAERRLKQSLGITQKIKLTIAEMIQIGG